MLLDRWTESLELCERAVAIARAVGARQVEGHALNTLGLDLCGHRATVPNAHSTARSGARHRPRGRRRGRHRPRLRQPVRGEALLRRHSRRGRGRPRGARRGRRGRDQPDVRRRSSARTASRTPTSSASGTRRAGWAEESIATVPPGRARGATAWRAGSRCSSRRATSAPARCSRSSAASRRLSRRDAVPQPVPHRPRRGRPLARRPGCGARDDRSRACGRPQQNEWPRDHMRLFRVGYARRRGPRRGRPGAPRRRRLSRRRSRRARTCGQRSQPFLRRGAQASQGGDARRDRGRDQRPSRPNGRDSPDQPAVALWADAAARWERGRTPISSRTAAGARPRRGSATATAPAAATALVEAHRIATDLGARRSRRPSKALATTVPHRPDGRATAPCQIRADRRPGATRSA